MTLNKGKIFTYADDTALVFQGETWDIVQRNAEKGLHKVSLWLRHNLLTLNIAKTSFVQFTNARIQQPDVAVQIHTCQSPFTQQCSCTTLSKSKIVRYLGVLLDDKISWQPHIEMVSSRVRKLIWVFKNLRHVADSDLLRTVYYALAQSVIGYCIGVWGGACKTHLLRLERAQRSLLKTMSFKPYRFPTKTLYELCRVFTVRQLFIFQLITKKHVSTPYDPGKLRNKRITPNVIESVRCRTAFARRQYAFLSVCLYNKINRILNFYPLTLKECKLKVKNWLFTLDYEDVEKIINN